METTAFHFRLKPMDEALLPQVSAALEKRTELISRSQYPGLWQQTDRLNSKSQSSGPSKTRHRIFGIAFLVLGIAITVPSILVSRGMLLPLIIGILAIINGIVHLFRGRDPGPSTFDKAAEQLLSLRAEVEADKYTAFFSPEGLVIASKEKGEDPQLISYDHIEYLIEAPELYLLTSDDRAILLQKSELTEAPDDFRTFLSKKARWISLPG